jgi:hypothetical protein
LCPPPSRRSWGSIWRRVSGRRRGPGWCFEVSNGGM